jgi:hypothetical protein
MKGEVNEMIVEIKRHPGSSNLWDLYVNGTLEVWEESFTVVDQIKAAMVLALYATGETAEVAETIKRSL